jgi:hypothetical protein
MSTHASYEISTIFPVELGLCGTELNTMNPSYGNRFASEHKLWTENKLKVLPDEECQTYCVDPLYSDNLRTYFGACSNCVRERLPQLSDPIQQKDVLQGAGCSLCVSIVAPWAYQQQTDRLPTMDEIHTFIKGGPLLPVQGAAYNDQYEKALETFQKLPACEQATWLSKMCGLRTNPEETSYIYPTYGVSWRDPLVEGFTGLEWVGIILGTVIGLLLVGLGLLRLMRWWNNRQEKQRLETDYSNNLTSILELIPNEAEREAFKQFKIAGYRIMQKYKDSNNKDAQENELEAIRKILHASLEKDSDGNAVTSVTEANRKAVWGLETTKPRSANPE